MLSPRLEWQIGGKQDGYRDSTSTTSAVCHLSPIAGDCCTRHSAKLICCRRHSSSWAWFVSDALRSTPCPLLLPLLHLLFLRTLFAALNWFQVRVLLPFFLLLPPWLIAIGCAVLLTGCSGVESFKNLNALSDRSTHTHTETERQRSGLLALMAVLWPMRCGPLWRASCCCCCCCQCEYFASVWIGVKI